MGLPRTYGGIRQERLGLGGQDERRSVAQPGPEATEEGEGQTCQRKLRGLQRENDAHAPVELSHHRIRDHTDLSAERFVGDRNQLSQEQIAVE